jgi:uncharacterized membrane protein YeaQ/YmgE (transglycosylase-associated protein family)
MLAVQSALPLVACSNYFGMSGPRMCGRYTYKLTWAAKEPLVFAERLSRRSNTRMPRLEDSMSIIAWLVLGLIAGFIASKIVNKTGEGLILDIVLGIIGAIVGGFLATRLFGESDVTGLNLYSIVVAIIGAIIVLLLYHLVFRRRTL